jgi:hypothetical protein
LRLPAHDQPLNIGEFPESRHFDLVNDEHLRDVSDLLRSRRRGLTFEGEVSNLSGAATAPLSSK